MLSIYNKNSFFLSMVKVIIRNPISNCAIQKLQPDKIHYFQAINLYGNVVPY